MEQEANVLETEQMSTESNDNTQNEGKVFTQEEVNRIIEGRLKREREKINPTPDPKEAELAEREQKLHEREMKLDASEKLKSESLPHEFIDLLNLTDNETCSKSIEIAHKIYKAITGNDRKPGKTGRTPCNPDTQSFDRCRLDEGIRDAFLK